MEDSSESSPVSDKVNSKKDDQAEKPEEKDLESKEKESVEEVKVEKEVTAEEVKPAKRPDQLDTQDGGCNRCQSGSLVEPVCLQSGSI